MTKPCSQPRRSSRFPLRNAFAWGTHAIRNGAAGVVAIVTGSLLDSSPSSCSRAANTARFPTARFSFSHWLASGLLAAHGLAGAPQAVAADYVVTQSRTQDFIVGELTQNYTVQSDPTIDGVTARSTGDLLFVMSFATTMANEYPDDQGLLGSNRAFQNLRFENSTTANAWDLQAIAVNSDPLLARMGTKYLGLTDTTLNFSERTAAGGASSYVKDFVLGSGNDQATLAFNNGHLDTSPSPNTAIGFGSDTIIDVSGTDNRIKAPSGALTNSDHRLELKLNAGSTLNVVESSEISSTLGGVVTLASGSRLNISDSSLYLTNRGDSPSTLQTTITDATIDVAGTFGSGRSSLYVTDPQINGSTVQLKAGTRLFSIRRSPSTAERGRFDFSGTNTIEMEVDAQLLSEDSSFSESAASFVFSNGTSTLTRVGTASGANPALRAGEITLDNATVSYSNVDLGRDLTLLTVRNGSVFQATTELQDYADVSTLIVNNSTVTGMNTYGSNAVLTANLTDATLSINNPTSPSGSTFVINGVNGVSTGSVNFSGANTIISRLDPAGTDIGGGISAYSDAFYFNRSTDFTDPTSTVNGLGTVTVTLAPFALNMTAADYASGGPNGDGIYDLLYFGRAGTATTDATTDTDLVSFAFATGMPAGLVATQVAFPSSDHRVSVQLSVVPEPSTIASLAIGVAAGLFGIARRRRKKTWVQIPKRVSYK